MGALNDAILDVDAETLTVSRTPVGAYDPVTGLYVPSASSTFTIVAAVQPAFNLNRIIGGADLSAHVDLQHATDVRQLHTATLLKTRTPTTDPDVILGLEDANWTVARVERWTLDGETHYHCVIAKQTGGGS